LSNQHKSAGYLVAAGLLGWLFSSSVLAVNLWAALLLLRYYEVIDSIIPYRACFLLMTLFVSARIYDKAITKDK
jgi:hypothetical protein